MKTIERMFVLKGMKGLALILLRTTKSKNGIILFVINIIIIIIIIYLSWSWATC